MRRFAPSTALAVALTLALASVAQALPIIDGGDAAVRPQDDLYLNANGGWIASTEIPGDKRSYGTFMRLREKADADVRALIEAAAAHPGKDPQEALIGDFYSSLMDLDGLDKAGLTPIKPLLQRIDAMQGLSDVAATLGELEQDGVGGPVVAYVDADEKNPTVNVVLWTQSGLGMPDRDYYLKSGADSDALRAGYEAYLAELFGLSGTPEALAAAKAAMGFETELAKIQWSRTQRRDAIAGYNPTTRQAWAKEYAPFPWERYALGLGMPKSLGSIVNEPTYLKAFSTLAAQTPLTTWKAYLRGRVLDTFAPDLERAYRDAYFRFKNEKLQGLTTMPPRWKTVVDKTNDALGEAIGQRYVAKHFPPAAKTQMKQLIANLLSVYRTSLTSLEWMTPPTRHAALDKLSRLTVKIGYPDKWRGYKGLVVKRHDGVGNLIRADRFDFARRMAEAGQPVDKTRWVMNPQTVNAYYNPVGNEIVFPAAILQAPFFDPAQDPAFNYGAIGAVIGHEISHGFDDQGRHYDASGALRDWWTTEDEKAFNARAERLVAQYSAYEPLPGQHVNGQLTLGENIADLTGVAMAFKAYHLELGTKPAPVVEGLSGDQRFFLGYARVWRSKTRPEWLKTRLLSDPHSPEQYRTNGVVTNLEAFYEAFGVKEGDRLYRAPAERVRIW